MPKATNRGEVGLETRQANQQELDMLQQFYNRVLYDVRLEGDGRILRKYKQYEKEIQTALEHAKYKFGSEFQGHEPDSGKFGVSRIRAPYFGFNSWEDCPDAVEDDTVTWLDNSVPTNLNGTGGIANPLTVGEPVVHLVLGVSSKAQVPKADAVKFRLNDQPETVIPLDYQFSSTDIRAQFLQSGMFLREDDDVYAEFYGNEAGSESLRLEGLTFIQAKDYRELDPANVAGTDSDNVVVE
jgi:hypothetical protein